MSIRPVSDHVRRHAPFSLLHAFLILAALATSVLELRAQEPRALAPILVEPYDGREVVDERIVWSWFMQSRADDGREIICDLVVVEILEGQSIDEAMRLNPPVILRRNLSSATWQTSPFARDLAPGHRYAWQIVAKVRAAADGEARVVSRSELWQFTYLDPTEEAEEEPAYEAVAAADPLLPIAADTLHDPATGLPNETLADTLAGDGAAATQDVPAPITIDGRARHTLATENRRGNLSTTPVRYDRLQIDPTLRLFGVPLELSVLLTTEHNLRGSDISRGALGARDVRRGLNLALQQRIGEQIGALESELARERDSATVDSLAARLGGDSATIAARIAELEALAGADDADESLEALQRLNLLTPEQRVLARFPSFGFGAVAPSLGSLLFDRVTINGGAVEYNPDMIYVGAAVGTLQRDVDPSILELESLADSARLADPVLSVVEFHRNLYSLRLGYGRRHASYVALTGLYADDDDASRSLQSIANRPIVRFVERVDSLGETLGVDTILAPNRVVGRQRNYAVGGVGRLELEELGLDIDGELNLAWFDDDANRPAQQRVPQPQRLPGFLRTDSMLTDFDFAVRAGWTPPIAGAGTIDAGIRYVGGGFRSVGIAGLRTDVLRADARYSSVLLDRQVRVGVRYTFEEAGYKDSSNTSRIDALGASLELRLHGLPALTVGYQRHGQDLVTGKSDPAQLRHVDNAIEDLSASVAWLQQSGDVRWASFLTAMLRNGRSAGDDARFQPDSAGVFRSRTLQLDNRIAIGPRLTLGVRGAFAGTLDHPFSIEDDSVGGRRLVVGTTETALYSLDLSALVVPIESWNVIVGAVTTYQRDVPQAAVRGGYVSSRLDLGDIAAIELRFEYRETAAPALAPVFPVERIGRVTTTARF